jgi:hypothetical protein
VREWRPRCSRCFTYPATSGSICGRCAEEERQLEEALEREEALAQAPPPPPIPQIVPRTVEFHGDNPNPVPYCSRCLSANRVSEVRGVRLCWRCAASSECGGWDAARSYGMSAPTKKKRDIY